MAKTEADSEAIVMNSGIVRCLILRLSEDHTDGCLL
jgi:hypothetical protein